MKFRDLLAKYGCVPENSIFRKSSNRILSFDMPDIGGLTCRKVSEADCVSQQYINAARIYREMLNGAEPYRRCVSELRRQEGAAVTPDELRMYRARRKDLIKEKNNMEKEVMEKIYKQLFGTEQPSGTLCRNKYFLMTSVSLLEEIIPPLKNLNGQSGLWHVPLLTADMAKLREAVTNGNTVAVEGGPCLFGADEVSVTVTVRGGERYEFDFVTEKMISGSGCGLSEFAAANRGKAEDISFGFRKEYLTEAEYQSLLHVFDMSAAFSAKAYIPIPDFSYRKYMNCILCELFGTNGEREKPEREFGSGLRRISGLYIDAVNELEKLYPDVRVCVISADTPKLLDKYIRKREPFLKNSTRTVKTLTSRAAKRESILDYITMPALPYYLDGITDIIQTDCMDEVVSCGKCRKIHKGILRIYPFLYPEELSGDGVNTVYYADRCWKRYRIRSGHLKTGQSGGGI